MQTFLLSIMLLSLSWGSPKLPAFSVTKIKQGKLLDKAKDASLDDFFESWMDRNIKKATKGSWIAIYSNEEFLFWGWTTFEDLVSTDPTVKEFYRTPIQDVTEKFPNYETVHGHSIREKLEVYITKSIAKKAKVTVDLGFKAFLIGETIVIQTPATIKVTGETKSEKVNYNLILNRDNLDLIKIEAL